MSLKPAAFAVPGDITQKTGGYIYEHQLLLGLRAEGRAVEHIVVAGTFPDPGAGEMEQAVAAMAGVPEGVPLIIDGLVFGSVDTDGLRRVAAPIVAMIHHPLGLETGLPEARARHLLEREAANLALAAHVVVPSPHTARILCAEFGVASERISIALPGFAAADPVRQPQTPPLILSVGLLAARKGHDVLLEALARIADLDWRAEIVGKTYDAEVEAGLRARIKRLGLGGRVGLMGLVSDAVLTERYRAATIFALATRYEGYGIVFGEALAHGLPIVTCRTGAVPETVPEGAGLLVPVDAPEAFAAALRHLLVDDGARAEMAAVSTAAGQRLPRWADKAAVMSAVLDRLAG